jgi:hypothetical protein
VSPRPLGPKESLPDIEGVGVNGFMFTAACECGGELSELTRSHPHGFKSGCRVVCRVCGRQFDIEARMTRHAHGSEDSARQAAMEAMADMGSRN